MAKKQPEPKTFEEAIGELEAILNEMERGETPLEESIARYERGNYLITFCRGVLGKAEQQIEQMQQKSPANPPAATEDDGDDE
ncbi:MAG: exodeoxyribonuclease VII small subunit [Tepidisphaeraceae bacterium]